MLTARQYEGIGRLTIAFNEIDAVLKAYLPLVVEYSKCTLLPPHDAPWTFHRRAVAIRMALESASAVNEIVGAYAGSIINILDMAKTIATKRNEYVHAVAFIDFTTNTRMLQMRSGDAPPDEKQIFELANEAVFVASKLAGECEALLRLYLSMNQTPPELELGDEWDEDSAED
jgi:hypothetical protein